MQPIWNNKLIYIVHLVGCFHSYEYVFVKRDIIKLNELFLSCSRGVACVWTRRHIYAAVKRHAFRKTRFERAEHGLSSKLLQNERYIYG
jgi:hypothetical protein